ncbi:hypothetical protein N9B17_07840 [Rhodopirellula sp.]|nr:hypothetical protein [Rhodopirellula sp.]
MSDFPTENEIREAYEPVFRFLDSIPEIIGETQSATDSEILNKRADELDEQVTGLVVPFTRLAKLRALANQLAEPHRVEESDAWVADLASTLGQGIANWVRNIGYHLFSHELAAVGRRQLSPFDYQRPENPFTEEDFHRCRDLLINEEALLIAAQKSAVKQGSDLQADSPKVEKFSKESQRKGSKGKQSISDRSLHEQILAALRMWHKYDHDDFQHAPIGVRDLASLLSEASGDLSKNSKSSVSRFFNRAFGGHKRYSELCHREEIQFHLQNLSGDVDYNQFRVKLEDIADSLQAKTEQDSN